jgi:hypothetical protein
MDPSEERIIRPYAHEGVDRSPESWQADDLQDLRQQYVSALVATRPEVASAMFEGVTAVRDDGGGSMYVRLSIRDLSWKDLVDIQTGGDIEYKTVRIPFDGSIQVPVGVKPRKRVVSYTLDAVVVQQVEKVTGDRAAIITRDWNSLKVAELNNWKAPTQGELRHRSRTAVEGGSDANDQGFHSGDPSKA